VLGGLPGLAGAFAMLGLSVPFLRVLGLGDWLDVWSFAQPHIQRERERERDLKEMSLQLISQWPAEEAAHTYIHTYIHP